MMAKLKVAGTWVGVVEVELEKWTVSMLRAEIARRSNTTPDSISLISAGRVLKDGEGSEKLSQLGIKNNSKVLSSRVNADQKKELLAEEERSSRLARIKAAATALAQRHADGSLPLEDFNIELEDQSGKKVNLGSETDQRAVMMGLMFHTKGKQLIRKQKYKDALEVLEMSEEAFSLCNPQVIKMIDNVPILQIDMAWCYFMLRDISSISTAGVRLQKAREGIEQAHGKDYSRIRLLQGGHPEIALHLRLELLEGVVAYHTGQFEDSRKALTSAQSKFLQLQVPDEALSVVVSMGFKERDAKRALRMNNQDVGAAVDFLVKERAKRKQKQEEDRRRHREIMEKKSYGVTPMKKAVDLERLNELVSIGYEKVLAAEALRRNENDTQKALDDLTNPDINAIMQQYIESRKRKRQRNAENEVVEKLVAMGFERSRVVEVVQTNRTVEQAMQTLLSQTTLDSSSVSHAAATSSQPTTSENIPGPSSSSDDLGAPNEDPFNLRDVEMEDEIAYDLAQVDAFSDYDINVTKEGEAIEEYLVLLASKGSTCSEYKPQ
ncbi:hypothetical protein SAY87_017366 [Trapa incisa]|uniref:NEDD8 ultimate buster 1 n=1 Tax=Trapa incisa TaxID=236973 RepID=A0AAN7LAA4_9MYRT|nr:hypothetical protein SAY87_017366 [Trapa incisa]